ncbi:RNA polymerase sigma factor [Sphingobacterium griseoflavum]|uniref:DNA-directed RNA polymerase sigma-70 factor n=1 Tax=Sphingobacterium griseoflavum TaxID=1474952 RepID=A0ABQ3HWZ6_9SPHI|nr:RNA polymerase sigma-70 factor [Sphingobacterium griseoflavum]GHE28549.1 DNA-directed RNA polymerase sigma-70 factor [Sphingobacterium griseoflavum]
MNQAERQMLMAVAEADEKAFTSLYNQYFATVYPFVLGYLKSPDMAEDVSQEIFVKVWQDRERLRDVRCFKAYVLVIAKNQTLNYLRKIFRTKALLAEVLHHYQRNVAADDHKVISKEYQDHLQRALRQLSPTSKLIFQRCREEKRSYDEVAEEMGISKHAIKKHMVRTMKTLRIMLERLDVHLCLLTTFFKNLH